MLIDLLRKVLTRANLKPQYLNLLLSRVDLYQHAFTSESYDAKYNYEIYELLGDASVNKFLVWYFYRRFPQLHCSGSVKVLSRLKINYASKVILSQIADKLGFWPYIRATNDEREKAKKSLLEDVFEAFIGLTELIVDEYFAVGVGYVVVNDILTSILDTMPISLQFEDLYDAKTRLKELFDANRQLGKLVYDDFQTTTVLYQIVDGIKKKMAESYGAQKAGRHQEVSKTVLESLAKQGISRTVNYNLFCE